MKVAHDLDLSDIDCKAPEESPNPTSKTAEYVGTVILLAE
jgi:hypothetical protein